MPDWSKCPAVESVPGRLTGPGCSPGEGTESLAGEPGFSLNSPLILS